MWIGGVVGPPCPTGQVEAGPSRPFANANERTRRINTLPHSMSANLYILFSHKDSKTYTGSTAKTIQQRLEQHQNGRVKSTKNRLPLELIYSKEYKTLLEARKQEKFYKTSWGRRKLKKILDPIIKEKFYK